MSCFLALLGAWIAAEMTSRFQFAAEFDVHLGEAASNGKLDGSSLARKATPTDHDLDVELIHEVGLLEGSENLVLQRESREIFFEGAIIDDDLSGSFGHPNPSDRSLATPGGGIDCFGGGHWEMW